MSKLLLHKTEDDEWAVMLDDVKVGVVYRSAPGEYRGQYTYVDRSPGEFVPYGGGGEVRGNTLREAAIGVEERHNAEFIRMQAVARSRRAERVRIRMDMNP